MNISLDQLLPVVQKEATAKLPLIVFGFALIAVIVAIIGFHWPKLYYSSTSLYADQKNVIRPLVEGLTTTTQNITQTEARELIFSRKIMNLVLIEGGWADKPLTPNRQEEMINEIKSRIEVTTTGDTTRIEYSDQDPKRAFKVASAIAQFFIEETSASKKRESRDAFTFINSQVGEYHKKLIDAEERLKRFRSDMVDSRPNRQAEVYQNINRLEQSIQQAELDLKEAIIMRDSIAGQLSGESSKSRGEITASVYREKLQELQDQLDILRLSYHDSYPDIVRLKQQIIDIQSAVDKESNSPSSRPYGGSSLQGNDSAAGYTTLYEKLRSERSVVLTNIETFKTRINEYQAQLVKEKQRAGKMSQGEATEAELIRGYEVNKAIYDDLLRKREEARITMTLDSQKSGLTYKIQEQANLPVVPNGLRFMHFVIAGPVLGILGPLGLLVLWLILDPRIRSHNVLSERMQLPLLGVIPYANTIHTNPVAHKMAIITTVAVVGAVYAVLIWARLSGSEVGVEQWLPQLGDK